MALTTTLPASLGEGAGLRSLSAHPVNAYGLAGVGHSWLREPLV